MMGNQSLGTFLRFLVAGGLNTLFGLSAYSLFIVLHAQPWLALLLGTITAILFNFFTISTYAFRDLAIKRLPRFIMGYVIIYFINLSCLHWLRGWIDDPILIQVILAFPVALISYLLMARLVFSVKLSDDSGSHPL